MVLVPAEVEADKAPVEVEVEDMEFVLVVLEV